MVQRVISAYPTVLLTKKHVFYRIRKEPAKPTDPVEYDSPPSSQAGNGRLDSPSFPVMYGSQDLQVCIYECRVTAEDDLFVATLEPTRNLKLLDLTELLHEEGVSEFDSLDLAIHMLFLAGKHSYKVARDIATAAHAAGYDGLVFPSYFSLLRTGAMPFETTYGISHRRIKQLAAHEKSKTIANIALFGRPIEQDMVAVRCINRIVLSRVEYDLHFGPVGHEPGA
jgi:RES domain-containing protein